MKNDFADEIKKIEDEILALKTASKYTSIRSANYTSTANVYTGLYLVTYASSSEPIFSIIDSNISNYNHGWVRPRTPSGNSQVLEVLTTYADSGGNYITDTVSLSIVSNRAVTGIARIS